MIIWLTSYPKSGNTWLRTIISQILFYNETSHENPFEKFQKLKTIQNLKISKILSTIHPT